MVLVISGEGLYFDSAANGQKGTEENDRKKAGKVELGEKLAWQTKGIEKLIS